MICRKLRRRHLALLHSFLSLLHIPERSPLALQILRGGAGHARHAAISAERFVGPEGTAAHPALRGQCLGGTLRLSWRIRCRIWWSGFRHWRVRRRLSLTVGIGNFADW